MKKLVLTLCATLFLIISTFCFAQSERSRKFQISTGIEYRITPFDFKMQ